MHRWFLGGWHSCAAASSSASGSRGLLVAGAKQREKALLLCRQSPAGFKVHPEILEQKLFQESPLH